MNYSSMQNDTPKMIPHKNYLPSFSCIPTKLNKGVIQFGGGCMKMKGGNFCDFAYK